MPTITEALLLVALNDEKGTIHPSAWLGIDFGLRGAIIAELRERGLVVTWDKQIQRLSNTCDTGIPLLDEAWDALADCPSPGPIMDWMKALEEKYEPVRLRAQKRLVARGVLEPEAEDRDHNLEGGTNLPMKDGQLEHALIERVNEGVDAGAGKIGTRVGTLLALIMVTNLMRTVFDDPKTRRHARKVARKVKEMDSVALTVEECVQLTEGTWEM